MVPLRNARLSVAQLDGTSIQRRYRVREHYRDDLSCTFGICQQLRKSYHYIDIIISLIGQLERGQQILCFLPSTRSVELNVDILRKNAISASPLHAQLSGRVQKEALQNGTVFVATNIAETSLTFPCLRYVVDTAKVMQVSFGKIETVEASNATIQQRIGCLGRTMNGDYVALYTLASRRNNTRLDNILPKARLQPISDIAFLLSSQNGIPDNTDLQFPTGPVKIRANVDYNHYPILGGENMTKAFHWALSAFDCGKDILALAAMTMCFPTNQLQHLASSVSHIVNGGNGDISNIISVFRLLLVSSPRPPDKDKRDVTAWCNQKGLVNFARYFARAYATYVKMESHYNRSNTARRWPLTWGRGSKTTMQALVRGFTKNYFVHCHKIDGSIGHYSCLSDRGDGGDSETDNMRTLHSINSKSTVAKLRSDIIFALYTSRGNVEMTATINLEPYRLGLLQLVEKIDDVLEIPPFLESNRFIGLGDSEVANARAAIRGLTEATIENVDGKYYVVLSGDMHSVLRKEIDVRTALRVQDFEIKIDAMFRSGQEYREPQFKNLIKGFHNSKAVFRNLKYTWSNKCNVEIKVHMDETNPRFLISGRQVHCDQLKPQIDF